MAVAYRLEVCLVAVYHALPARPAGQSDGSREFVSDSSSYPIAFVRAHHNPHTVESPTTQFVFEDSSDAALVRWNRDHQPHRDKL